MAVAYAPIALLWGTVAAGQGLSPFQAWLMSAWVYSGAAQFVSMDLFRVGTPLLLMVFCHLHRQPAACADVGFHRTAHGCHSAWAGPVFCCSG